jgi:hypothetical protein
MRKGKHWGLPMAQEFNPVDHFFGSQSRPQLDQTAHSFTNTQTLLLNGDNA